MANVRDDDEETLEFADEGEAEPEYTGPDNCTYLQGCRWGSGCMAEGTCIGVEVER
jgi:hypothetical protein